MNQSINTDSKNSKEPQQKYRLGTVSIKILGGFKRVSKICRKGKTSECRSCRETISIDTSFCSSHAYVMLIGDFNSRTSSHPDYIETDDFISGLFDFDSETTEFFSHINKLECLIF